MGQARASRGVQAEVLLALAVVMVTATALLSAFFIQTHASQMNRLRSLVGRALIAEARAGARDVDSVSPGVRWWTISRKGMAREKSSGAGPADRESIELAREARTSGVPQLRSGAPWEPIRFAVVLNGAGEVAVARLPAAVSRSAVLALLLVDVAVFAALGASLLRRRVVLPLRRVAAAAHLLAEGGVGARVPVTGVGEAEELARAFNGMSEALQKRTGALEKAVSDLRDANNSLRRARAGIERAERLAAVGRLAAGVAHEVGNPMGALLAFLDLAARDEGLSEPGRNQLRRASEEGQRVRTILRQLLDFSRPPRARAVPLDLAAVAEHAVGLVRAQKRSSGIEWRVTCRPRTQRALADEGLVVQILLNLLLNAADAVRDVEEPRVFVRVESTFSSHRKGEAAGAAAQRREPDAVVCEVSDNGPGVASEDRERIFDPFFTSKPPGEGTGLGLPNALRLAEQQGGSLEVRSARTPGGAAFRLQLPAAGGAGGELRTRVREDS